MVNKKTKEPRERCNQKEFARNWGLLQLDCPSRVLFHPLQQSEDRSSGQTIPQNCERCPHTSESGGTDLEKKAEDSRADDLRPFQIRPSCVEDHRKHWSDSPQSDYINWSLFYGDEETRADAEETGSRSFWRYRLKIMYLNFIMTLLYCFLK